MKPSLRIEQEFSSFIQFADLMTRELRASVAEWLYYHLFDPAYPALLHLSQSEIPVKYPNWFELFRQILEMEGLRETTSHNEDLSISVTRSTLSWARQIYQQFETSYARADEEEDYKQILAHRPQTAPPTWADRLIKLNDWYPDHRQTWDFYRMRISADPPESGEALDVLQQNILDDWAGYLFAEKKKLEAGYLKQAIDQHIAELTVRVDHLLDLGDLVSPFYNFIGQAWSDSVGNWDRIDWHKMETYAQTLQGDTNLQDLARLLGRWNVSEQEAEEEKMKQPITEETWEPNPYGKSEIIGITQSDHLSAMLPTEVALLSSPETELIFAKKFVEKKLLTFEYRSDDLSTQQREQPEVSSQAKRSDKGPLILCIDTSGSMFGEPEQIAKSLALAILNIALKQKRKAYLISFSTAIRTLEMTGMENDIGKMVDFLSMSFHGGTDIQPAIKEALTMLKREGFREADVLVISDFVIPRLDKDVYEQLMESRRHHDTHYHGLLVVRSFDSRVPPLPIFDHHWIYDIDNPQVMRQTIAHFRNMEHPN